MNIISDELLKYMNGSNRSNYYQTAHNTHTSGT